MSSTRPPGEGSEPRSAIPTPASERDARTQGSLRGVESILAAPSGAGSSSGAALAGRASPAEVHPDPSNPVDRLFKVSRNHPLEALDAGITALTTLIEGDESKRQDLQLSDLQTIRDFLIKLRTGKAKESQRLHSWGAFKEIALNAGIFASSEVTDNLLELLQIADSIAAEAVASAQPLIGTVAAALRQAGPDDPAVLVLGISDALRRFKNEKGARFRARHILCALIYDHWVQAGPPNIQTFEQLTPSLLLAALDSAAHSPVLSGLLNQIAKDWGSGELIAAAAEQGLTPGQSTPVMTDLLLRLGIIEPC